MKRKNISSLRIARLIKGLTMDDIYVQSGRRVHHARLSRIERGIFKATAQEKTLITRILGYPKADLFPE